MPEQVGGLEDFPEIFSNPFGVEAGSPRDDDFMRNGSGINDKDRRLCAFLWQKDKRGIEKFVKGLCLPGGSVRGLKGVERRVHVPVLHIKKNAEKSSLRDGSRMKEECGRVDESAVDIEPGVVNAF